MDRRAWHTGLKTTCYLRTLGASNIENSTVSVKKEDRGLAGVEEIITAPKRKFTENEKLACSIEAMKNGEVCETWQ